MISKIEMFNHPNYIFAIFGIIVFYVLEESNFNHSLFLQFLLISHYFKSHVNIFLMVITK